MGARMRQLAASALVANQPPLKSSCQDSDLPTERVFSTRSPPSNESSSSQIRSPTTRIAYLKKLARLPSFGSRRSETLGSESIGKNSRGSIQGPPSREEWDRSNAQVNGLQQHEKQRQNLGMLTKSSGADAPCEEAFSSVMVVGGTAGKSGPRSDLAQNRPSYLQRSLSEPNGSETPVFSPTASLQKGTEGGRNGCGGDRNQRRQTMRELKLGGSRWNQEEDALLLKYVEVRQMLTKFCT
jgi:hypothetical protein